MRRHGVLFALLVFAAGVLAGCGDAVERAALFRAEKRLYEARKAEEQARLASTPPDSAALLRLRAAYLKVRMTVPGPYKVDWKKDPTAIALPTIRAVGAAEAAAARLALEARRPDLALEAGRQLEIDAAQDTVTSRQAAFIQVAAYQSMRRYDDAIAEMKAILKKYRPMPPPPNGEDPVLSIPDAIVGMRRNLGDQEGATRELRDAIDYYESVIAVQRPPALEAQVRARILRNELELGQVGRALQEVNTLERLVTSTPSLRSMLAEVAYAKGKIKAQTDKDPREGIDILDRIATDFPNSPLAPQAIFEAGTQAEAKGMIPDAKARYEAVLQRFPHAEDVAPLSLYRLGLIQEKMGDWQGAKSTLESVPVRFPRSAAAAEAPIAVIQHYLRDGRKTTAELYYPKALETYRGLIQADSSGQAAPIFRVKMFQIYMAKKDSSGVYAITDEMLRADPKHPYTAQLLLQGAKAAREFGNTPRGVAYLRQFLQNFPNSPLAGDVRREIKEHGG